MSLFEKIIYSKKQKHKILLRKIFQSTYMNQKQQQINRYNVYSKRHSYMQVFSSFHIEKPIMVKDFLVVHDIHQLHLPNI